MNSETSTRYGSRVRRQGRSRPCRRNQRSSRRRNSTACTRPMGRRGVDSRGMGTQDKAPSAASTTYDVRQVTGRWILEGASDVGRLTYFIVDLIRGLSEVRIWWPRMLEEAWNIGAGSLFIVLLIAAFAGAVTALQTGYQFTGSIPYYVVGTLVVSSIILELGPVLTALILA